MLVNLRIGTPPPSTAQNQPEAVRLLAECHTRIRTNLTTAQRLAGPDGLKAPPEQRVEAARGLVRYFGTAMPLHALDEDLSLVPRLQGRGTADDDARLKQLSSQHHQSDELLARLLLLWKAIVDQGGQNLAPVEALAQDTMAFATLMTGHLEMEEGFIFPLAAKLLSAEELDAVASESRGRRGH